MPAGLKAAPRWAQDRAFIVAEVLGTAEADAAYRRWRDQYGAFSARFGRYWRYTTYEVYCFFGSSADAIRLSREDLEAVGSLFHPEAFDLAADRYVCGQSSDEALLAAVTKHGDLAHAHYLVGMTRLAEGDRPGAVKHFAEVEGAVNFVFGEEWGHLLLKRLREDPTWPPWIPVKDNAPDQTETEVSGDGNGG